MAINQGPKITSSNIVLSYDMGDLKNSYLGEPTTNYIYHQNPRIDSSYTPYIVGSHSNWLGMHPGAITVYDQNNNDISGYVNTGITVANSGVDWTQARHAYWVYDEELKRPVVQMYNAVSTWQAKSFGTGMNAWATYGFTQGTQYTISWNQWVTSTSIMADVGLYTVSGSSASSFWDGRSYGSVTSTNTKTHTWERVYHTFTVGQWNTSNSYSAIYMYGMNSGPGHIVRIADVQLEIKNHPTPYSDKLTRSNIYDNLRDQTGRSNAFYTDISYTAASVPQPIFDGTNDYISSTLAGVDMTNFSIECWFNAASISAYRNVFDMNYTTYATASVGNVGPRLECNGTSINVIWSGNTGNNNLYNASTGIGISTNTWYHYVMTGAAGSMKFYLNGVYQNAVSTSAQGYRSNFSDINIGRGFCLDASRVFLGRIPVFKIYNKVLTDNQVYNNYIALRSRFT